MAVVLMPTDGSTPIRFDRPILLVGRHPDCDIILTNSKKVSRKHCCLALVNNRLLVRDLDSMNGVRVNGKDVKHESVVKLGDIIQIGDVDFKVETAPDNKKKIKSPAPQNSPKPEQQDKPAKNSPIPSSIDPNMLSFDFPVALPDNVEDSDNYIIPPLKD